jgi:multiple sugar transport system substrate-binding protein
MVANGKNGLLPAVSEVGTSWVPGLAGMNALQPVPAGMMSTVEGAHDYVPQSWRSCFQFGDSHAWAIPWICGSRVLYYRKDILAEAGVDPETAFADPQSMVDAVLHLRDLGVALPWITSNVTSLNTLHLISTWIWAGGGDFVSEDGRHLVFAEPGAIESMSAFFQMGRCMGPKRREYTYGNAIDLFWRGDAAITMDGTWMYADQKSHASQKVLDNLGVALAPGPAFVGGSNLVVWANHADAQPAWELLKFLSEPDSVSTMCALIGLAPAKLSLLHAQGAGSAFDAILNRAMETGRAPSNHRFSSIVEDNLHYAFGLVWADMLKFPDKNPRDSLRNYILPLKARLEATMV